MGNEQPIDIAENVRARQSPGLHQGYQLGEDMIGGVDRNTSIIQGVINLLYCLRMLAFSYYEIGHPARGIHKELTRLHADSLPPPQ